MPNRGAISARSGIAARAANSCRTPQSAHPYSLCTVYALCNHLRPCGVSVMYAYAAAGERSRAGPSMLQALAWHEPSKTLDRSQILPAAQHPTHAALIESKRTCKSRINPGMPEQPFLQGVRAPQATRQ
jgi:hypothetical protein